MSEALHTLYRPQTFDEVVGQGAVVAALRKVVERRGSQAFLFSGPSGCGKTTLARICAAEMGCQPKDILDVDAATRTGVDDMRQIQETLNYKPFGGSTGRAIIIDECHRLSGNAKDSILKSVEEPPAHVIWFFCTTEPDKIPETIKTRCTAFTLKSVKEDQLTELLESVIEAEKIELAEGVFTLILREAHGSPRQALVNLAACRDLESRQEAAEVLRTALESQPARQFCQFLLRPGTWQQAMVIIKKLEEDGTSPESTRIIVCNYVGGALKNAKSNEEACRFLSVLGAFATPYVTAENMAPLMLSLGRVMFDE